MVCSRVKAALSVIWRVREIVGNRNRSHLKKSPLIGILNTNEGDGSFGIHIEDHIIHIMYKECKKKNTPPSPDLNLFTHNASKLDMG